MEKALILAEGAYNTLDGKTAHGLVRYSRRFEICGVIDSTIAGKDAGEVLNGTKREIPIYASLEESLEKHPDISFLIIGVATEGGYMPEGYRNIVKKAITQGALFAPNSSRHQRHPIKRKFDELFPAAAKYLHDRKKKQHNELAKELQKAEANFIVFTVLEWIRQERPKMWAVPVHDSILMLRPDADYVMKIMKEEFEKLGLHPRLEVKELCQ